MCDYPASFRRSQLLVMLASTCRSGHGWLNTGTFAFSPPPSFSAKDDPLRWSSPTCSSLLHATSTSPNQNARNLLLKPCIGLRKRPYDLAIPTAAGASLMLQRGGSLSCLRGGSSAEGEPPPASKSDEDGGGVNGGGGGIPSPTATGREGGSSGGGGGGGDTRQQLEGDGMSTAFQRSVEPAGDAAAAAAAPTASEFGVALVTERSTATGGSKSRVSYSVLADGTLQVGQPRRRKATADLVSTQARQSSTSLSAPVIVCAQFGFRFMHTDTSRRARCWVYV